MRSTLPTLLTLALGLLAGCDLLNVVYEPADLLVLSDGSCPGCYDTLVTTEAVGYVEEDYSYVWFGDSDDDGWYGSYDEYWPDETVYAGDQHYDPYADEYYDPEADGYYDPYDDGASYDPYADDEYYDPYADGASSDTYADYGHDGDYDADEPYYGDSGYDEPYDDGYDDGTYDGE